jgi:hypothetical protein
MSQIVKPIFIIGPGRSGTTITLRLMSLHPDLAWFSGWTNRFTRSPQLSFLSRINGIPPLEKAARGLQKWPRPGETYRIWNYCFPGFSSASGDWDENQVNKEGAANLVRLIRLHLKWHGKSRFITKYTGWPRIRFLRHIFPDALFIYVDRDPRAVIFSYRKQKWWGKHTRNMSIPDCLEFYANRYLAFYQAKKQYTRENSFIQIYYEDLIQSPVDILQTIFKKCDLPWKENLGKRIASWKIKSSANEQWQQQLSKQEKDFLASLIEKPLVEMGYLPID